MYCGVFIVLCFRFWFCVDCGYVWRCLMKLCVSELVVGIFVILFGIVLFFIVMWVSGLVGLNFSDCYEMSVIFDNVNGLKLCVKVMMSGVKIG